APPRSGGDEPRRRRPVRILHPGDRGGGGRLVRAQPAPLVTRNQRGPGREHLPLHRLRSDRQGVRGTRREGSAMTTRTGRRGAVRGGVGESTVRPDGVPKLRGEFMYAQDMYVD